MANCSTVQEQLLDYLYDLLADDEKIALRAHVDICPACQVALQKAQAQQQLLAQAARIDTPIPEYVAPDFDNVSPAPQPVETAIQPMPTLPLSTPTNSAASSTSSSAPADYNRRPLLRFATWTAAAVVLIAAGWSVTNYQAGLKHREAQVAQTREKIREIDAQFALARENYEKKQAELPKVLRQHQLDLRVSGPARYQPAVASPIEVQTFAIDGKLAEAEVAVQVIDAKTKQTLLQRNFNSQGELAFDLPPGLVASGKEQEIKLQVQARTHHANAEVAQSLHTAPLSYASFLAVNKTTCYIGEVLFFRTLTLESFSLKPATRAIPLRFDLVDRDGKTVKQLVGVTGAGGIAAGEFALTTDIATGVYRLEVKAGDDTPMAPLSQRIEVVREITPRIETDRAKYNAGEGISLSLRTRGNGQGKPLANQSITVQQLNTFHERQAEAKNDKDAAKAFMQNLRTDANGMAYFQLPPKLDTNRAVLEIQVPHNKRTEKVLQAIPVVPSHVEIDFYPEGGDLVAGLPTRVYYRVRTPQGEAVDQPGRVIILSSTDVLHDSEPSQGTGVFEFTPKLGDSYSVRITAPKTEIQNPFNKLGIKAEGVVLSVPTGVTRAGEPIEIKLGNKGRKRDLLLLATCRGQIVGHKTLHNVREGETTLKLTPVAGTPGGVLRITVLEASAGHWTPVAERLVYRVPQHRLDVTASARPDKSGNNRMQLHIQGKNEAGQAASFWNLAAVVDERFRPEKETSLTNHFYLANDLRDPQSLEETHLVVGDAPEHWQALDLFLGTEGWRRFVPVPAEHVELAKRMEPGDAQNRPEKASEVAAVAAAAPVLFAQQNATPDKLRGRYQLELQTALNELHDDTVDARQEYIDHKENELATLAYLQLDLASYRQIPQFVLQALSTLFCLLCLGAGLFLLGVGFVRLARRLDATVSFGGALAAIAFSVVGTLAMRSALVDSERGQDRVKLAQVDVQAAPIERPSFVPDAMEFGNRNEMLVAAIKLPTLTRTANGDHDQLRKQRSDGKTHAAEFADLAPLARRSQHRSALSAFSGGAGGASGMQLGNADGYVVAAEKAERNNELKRRFLEAKKAQDLVRDQVAQTTPAQSQAQFHNAQNSGTPSGAPSNAKNGARPQSKSTLPGGPAGAKGSAQTTPRPATAPTITPSVISPQIPSPPTPPAENTAPNKKTQLSPPANPSATTKAEPAEQPKASVPPSILEPASNPVADQPLGWLGINSLVQRQYAYRRSTTVPTFQSTLLWHPALVATDGQAKVDFDLPGTGESYRILILSNDPTGRLGFHQSTIRTKYSASGRN